MNRDVLEAVAELRVREDWSDAARRAAALKRRVHQSRHPQGFPSVAEIRALPEEHQQEVLKAVAHAHQHSVWGDNRTFRRHDAYRNRLKKAGFKMPVVPNHPPASFQD